MGDSPSGGRRACRSRPPANSRRRRPTGERSSMSDQLREEQGLDVDTLRLAIQDEYAEVASDPTKGFHFHTGGPLTRILEYPDEWLEGIPGSSIERSEKLRG